MDFLHDHIAEVEEAIFFSTANLFNLDVDLIFYDTTTASFSVDEEDEIRKYGKSKEGGWNAQVVVALAVTKDGLPVRSWVFPGNTADVNTIATVRKDLRDWNLNRTLFVADAGLNSIKNRKELSKACGKYILAARMASVTEIKKKVLSNCSRYTVVQDNLRAKEVIIGNGERRRRYILCHNPKEEKRQKAHREQVVTHLKEEISKHKDKKATARWAIDLLSSKRYKRYLTVTETGKIRVDRKKIKEVGRYDGKWVIETNDDTISLEDAASGYKSLLVIERCFRSLKRTQIQMMPMYHWAPRRIEAHVKICVLALLIERIAEQICGVPWNHIRRELDKLQATEFLSDTHSIIRRNEIGPMTQSTLKKLGISTPNTVLSLNPRT
jgi:transposase